ncbi:MAR-binding filament-like protein 1-1 [Pyrus ussuriensis x Pyrus communis]|uniref:MAR-binding filament-like protein 1-1 n=1 Tax=Pyrus ussuriensis x Pyrus communis TaxID=2448454 RepID=A0A5N5FCI6_9ROSA|nr:MAR-binding filament-like protein 1-1 [Pyrus ussuriensis x Pyrus communis]
MGSSCFLHSPLSLSPFPSSSSSSSHPIFLCSSSRNADTRRRRTTLPMASLRQEDSNDGICSSRRAILFVGISVLPFLQLRGTALEGLATKQSELKTLEESKNAEEAPQTNGAPNPVLSLLNGIGIFSSGVVGALYVLTQSEKKATDAMVESMKTKLKEKEAAIVSLGKSYESKLLGEQEERRKQLAKAREEQNSLTSQLSSAKSTIASLRKELNGEKKLIEELKIQIDSLKTNLSRAGEEKVVLEENLKEKQNSIEVLQGRIDLLNSDIKDKENNVQSLGSSLVAKDMELKDLKSIYNQTRDELANTLTDIQKLKGEVLKNQKELDLKNLSVDELNATVSSLISEIDDLKRKFVAIQEEYNKLKTSSARKADLDSKLLGEKEEELQQLKEKLELAPNDTSRNKEVIADLTRERENLKEILDKELENEKNLKHELKSTQEALVKSRSEASNLENQLKQSKTLCTELEAEISRVQAEFAGVRESLQRSLDEATLSGDEVAGELAEAKELLKKTNEELQVLSQDLATVVIKRDSLQEELVDVYKDAERASNDLKEEKELASSLKKEVQALEKQISKDKQSRKSLETDLEGATKALDEMSRNALVLSQDFERANSLISSLEDEKKVVYKSLTEQKIVSKEARENMEDGRNLAMRISQERDGLEKRSKKLEEELASAKGEILWLRNQINSSKHLGNNQQLPEKAEEPVTVAPRKRGRRKKAAE